MFLFELLWKAIKRMFSSNKDARIDNRLKQTLGAAKGSTYSITIKEFAAFRTVDLFQAIEVVVKNCSTEFVVIDSEHHDDLNVRRC